MARTVSSLLASIFALVLVLGASCVQAQPWPSSRVPPADRSDGARLAPAAAILAAWDGGKDGQASPVAVASSRQGAEQTERDAIEFFARTITLVRNGLGAVGAVAGLPAVFFSQAPQDRTPAGFVAALLLAVAAALLPLFVVNGLTSRLRHRLGGGQDQRLSALALITLAVSDTMAVLATFVVAHAAAAVIFAADTLQNQFASWILASTYFVALYLLPFRICFRPGFAAARLAAIGDEDARRIVLAVAASLFILVLGRLEVRLLRESGIQNDVLAGVRVIVLPVVIGLLIGFTLLVRKPVERWLSTLGGGDVRLVVGAARHWPQIAAALLVALAAVQIHSIVTGTNEMFDGAVVTVTALLWLLLIETAIGAFGSLRGRPIGAADGRIALAVRCGRVAMLVGAALWIAETWVLSLSGLPPQLASLADVLPAVGVTLLIAYVAYEGIMIATASYLQPRSAQTSSPVVGTNAAPAPTSRAATLVPLLRITLVGCLIVLTALTVLGQIGVNVTALIAGASVVGLAISFGSQTLVKDIVSGVFYLVDDAFRVGEYIEGGGVKGTVDGFTIRSLRLRHQDGQLHTIPFGQLGRVTNFSRDWAMVKFNLRFPRTTDLEKLRKIAKRIGEGMKDDAELAEDILEPLKMQGIVDIVDDIVVARFKMTVKPNNPSLLRREALRRLLRGCASEGVAFGDVPGTTSEPALPGAGSGVVLRPGTAGSDGAAADTVARPR